MQNTHDLRFALPFRDHAIVQADQPLLIWGFGPATASLTLELDIAEQSSQIHTTTSDLSGRWEITLPAIEADISLTLKINCNGQQCIAADLLTGDLFLCGGQSNMEWQMNQIDGSNDREAATSNKVRFVKIYPHNSAEPSEDVEGNWLDARGNTAGECSAIGFYFAHHIYKKTGRPIGLIVNAVGGTIIETWLSNDVAMSCPEGQRQAEAHQTVHKKMLAESRAALPAFAKWLDHCDERVSEPGRTYDKAPPLPTGPASNQIAGCWNGMIAPLKGLSLKAVLWYQGESNVDHAEDYSALFKRLLKSWREHFYSAEKPLPFFTVQLAGFYTLPEREESDMEFTLDMPWPKLRAAQQFCADNDADCFIASAIDIGDKWNIHPFDKKSIANRLSHQALLELYGIDQGPQHPHIISVRKSDTDIVLECDQEIQSTSACKVMVSDEGGSWHELSATARGNQIIAKYSTGIVASSVAYGWESYSTKHFANSTGWPVLQAHLPIN